MKNAGKGSRQIRPVTLGKGLALVLCRSGCWGSVCGFLYARRDVETWPGAVTPRDLPGDAYIMQRTRTATVKGNPTV